VLAGAKAHLEDVTQAYLSQQATAQQLLSAQKQVTTAQDDLNKALDDTSSAASAAAAGETAVGQAAKAAAGDVDALTASLDAQANAVGKLGAAVSVAGINSSTVAPGTPLTQGPAGGLVPGGITHGILDWAANPNTLPGATSTTASSSAVASSGPTTTTSTISGAQEVGTWLVDEVVSGTLWNQLDQIFRLLGGGSGTVNTAGLQSAVSAGADVTAAAASTADAAATTMTQAASTITLVAGTMSTLTAGVVALASSVAAAKLPTNAVGATTSIAGLPSGTVVAPGAGSGGGTNVVGNTTTFTLQNVNIGNMSQQQLEDALVSTLRQSGARF